jgi:hypothetical protein
MVVRPVGVSEYGSSKFTYQPRKPASSQPRVTRDQAERVKKLRVEIGCGDSTTV